MPVNRR